MPLWNSENVQDGVWLTSSLFEQSRGRMGGGGGYFHTDETDELNEELYLSLTKIMTGMEAVIFQFWKSFQFQFFHQQIISV